MAEKYANNFVAHIQNFLTVSETDIFLDVVPPAALQVALTQPGNVVTDTWMAKIDDELVRVKDYDVNSNTITVDRAQEYTAAMEHDAGTVIAHVVTAGSLEATMATMTAPAVTFENLDANGDVGTGADQVPAGDHTHTHHHNSSYMPINQDWPIISWGQDGAVVVTDGVHKFPVPYNMTVTRIEAALDINGPAATTDFSIALQDVYVTAGSWVLRNAVTADPEVIITANDLDGSIITFANASIPAGDVLRLDIKGADALAESPVVTVWARRT